MKTFLTLVASALLLAASVQGHAHIGKRHRGGPSATPPTPSSSTVDTQPSASPAAPPSSPPVAGPKRGVSYNDVAATQQFGSKISWGYNWDSAPGGDLRDGVEYVPMLWSADPSHTTQWADNAAAAIASGSTHLLGFNEPDLGAQANMSPEDAAQAWKTYIEPFAGKAKLCSPAVTNGGAPMGLTWLQSFLQACDGCTIDCVAIHIYDSATNIGYYQNYISGAFTQFGKPVWVTEFGASGTVQQQQQFLNTMLPWLDSQDGVERYAYFMAGSDILVDSSNALTALGQTYDN